MSVVVGSPGQGSDRSPHGQRAVAGREPLLVFVHIPKTAGTAFASILELNEPPDRIERAGNVFKGGGGAKRDAAFEHLRRDDGALLDGIGLIRGHFPLGIRAHLPERRQARCFTFLRDPVERMLSHFYGVESASMGRAGLKQPKLAPGATLQAMLDADLLHDNLHTRMLCGDVEPFGEVTTAMLAQAKLNLRDELVFFGLTERFDESLVLAQRRLGFRTVVPPRVRSRTETLGGRAGGRVNDARPRGEEVPAEARAAAESANSFDIELYAYAQQLFEAAPERNEPTFMLDLAALPLARRDGEHAVPPAPAEFPGDPGLWRALVESRAGTLHDGRELALIKHQVHELRNAARKALPDLEDRRRRKRLNGQLDGDVEQTIEAASKTIETLANAVKAQPPVRRSRRKSERVESAAPARPAPEPTRRRRKDEQPAGPAAGIGKRRKGGRGG